MNLKENIKRILNESTFFRRRVDMSLMDKEFFEVLNYVAYKLITKHDEGKIVKFPEFKNRVIDYLIDNYHGELSDWGREEYPYVEVYEFLSNHFKDKIKEKYDLMFNRNINESKTLQENEEDPTQKILNFLLRRYEIEEHIFGDEDRPIIIKMLRIKNSYGQSYSIRSTGSKKEQIRDILDTLMILNVIDDFDFSKTKDNPYAQKAVRAVKMFYDKVMGNKSNMNESKILDKIKSFLGKKSLTKDDKLIDLIVKFIEENYSIDFTSDEDGDMTFYLTDNKGNFIVPAIMKYYPEFNGLEYKWDFTKNIHSWFSDDRLLHLDSEMMGKIFEKLFKKKVNKVNGYSRL